MSRVRRRRRGRRRSPCTQAPDEGLVGEVLATGMAVVELAEGRSALVAGALPGERVKVALERQSAARSVATLIDVDSPSRARVAPSCPLAGRCGGCDFMHVELSAQRELHSLAVTRLLQRALRGSAEVPDPTIHEPCASLRYRTRAKLFLQSGGGRFRVGYRGARSHDLVEVSECGVLSPALAPALAELAELDAARARGQGEAFVALAGDGRVVELRWRGRLGGETFAAIDSLVQSGRWAGARVWEGDAVEPATFGDPRPRVAGPDGHPLVVSAGGFAQASDAAGVALGRRVAELWHEHGEHTPAVELFAGSGTLTVALALRAQPLVAVESSPAAAACLQENLRVRDAVAKVRVADAEKLPLGAATRAVVLDPPRAGARGATQCIVAARPRVVVYVSCYPVTLARDVAVLTQAGWSLRGLELFEVFPQTSHVETVAVLQR